MALIRVTVVDECAFHIFKLGLVVLERQHFISDVSLYLQGMCEVLLNLEAATPRLTGKQIDAEVSHVEMLSYLTEERYSNLSQYSLNSKNKGQKETAKGL